MGVGVSSVYYSKEIQEGGRLLDALLDLGCDGLELEYRIGPETFRAMEPRLGRGVPVFSVHAFFPNPSAGPASRSGGANAFLFSSPDREERGRAVRQGIATIEAAERLGARAVVLHLGRVEVGAELLDPYRRLESLESEAGDPSDSRLREAVAAVLAARESRCPRHVDAVRRCLERLNEEAVRRGVLLGIENRFHPHELPNHEETGALLREFHGGAVRFWLDVGHALNQERLGISTLAAWLEAYGSSLAGTHLHDIRRGRDHLAPGTGEADFAGILRFLPPDAVKILEVRPTVPREELLAGRDLLRRLGY